MIGCKHHTKTWIEIVTANELWFAIILFSAMFVQSSSKYWHKKECCCQCEFRLTYFLSANLIKNPTILYIIIILYLTYYYYYILLLLYYYYILLLLLYIIYSFSHHVVCFELCVRLEKIHTVQMNNTTTG